MIKKYIRSITTHSKALGMQNEMNEKLIKKNTIYNYAGLVYPFNQNELSIENSLFDNDSLMLYTKMNLDQVDQQSNYFLKNKQLINPEKGGGQGDYKSFIRDKISNVVDCLKKYPKSKRAVLTIPYTDKQSHEISHDSFDEYHKCLRELHFQTIENELWLTGQMRAQSVTIFPKNIHFIGNLQHKVLQKLNFNQGGYQHHVDILIGNRNE